VILIEAAIDSVADAERSVREGAGRLEVCGDLSVGGITPSAELLRGCLALGVPCVAMARPRGGSFVHDDAERALILADASRMLSLGAHGVVFGVLRDDLTIDADFAREISGVCGPSESVFHRAFDETPDAGVAIDVLIDAGVSRVLTSGHAPTALRGIAEIAALVSHAARRISILPGGTVRGANVREIVTRSGVSEVHARGSAAPWGSERLSAPQSRRAPAGARQPCRSNDVSGNGRDIASSAPWVSPRSAPCARAHRARMAPPP
jgi:copper homeostasis protein